jgi:hypothetical protein
MQPTAYRPHMFDAERLESDSSVSQAGIYEELNIIGEPTGERIIAARGEQLPVSRYQFTWWLAILPKGRVGLAPP